MGAMELGLSYTAVNPPTHPLVQSITEKKSHGVNNETSMIVLLCVLKIRPAAVMLMNSYYTSKWNCVL